MGKFLIRMAAALGGVLALAAPAGAAGLASAYSDVDLGRCTLIDSDEMGGAWACPGWRGYPLLIAEGDLRMFVSYGFGAREEPAAGQTLPPFNHLGAKMEWLYPADAPQAAPIATILRWFTQRESGESEGQVLVVTQLAPGAVCHIAYIDALANADANALARRAAEELAGRFECNGPPRLYGAFAAFDVE